MSADLHTALVELTVSDRCDRCSARAVVQTEMLSGGTLLWCAHHFSAFSSALDSNGARIVADLR